MQYNVYFKMKFKCLNLGLGAIFISNDWMKNLRY